MKNKTLGRFGGVLGSVPLQASINAAKASHNFAILGTARLIWVAILDPFDFEGGPKITPF